MVELARKLSLMDGFHIITPIRGEKIVERIVKEIKKCL